MTKTLHAITQSIFELFFINRVMVAVMSFGLLALISLKQPLGVISGFVFVLVLLLVCVRRGSFAEIGFTRPESWARTLTRGLLIGITAQLAFVIFIDPLLTRLIGSPVNLSTLDGMRGNLVNYLIMLGVGWIVGGFLEEMLFRGYLLKRIQRLLGGSAWAGAVAVAITALVFGLAHGYQDIAGMLSTGLVGVLLGWLFVWSGGNLWLPILVHGISNSLGITFIYLSLDKLLGGLVFG